jgi:predicted unusual protein kinase regulating ubiquinone biosynthesis (AarF/ABC1/UbiB family)
MTQSTAQSPFIEVEVKEIDEKTSVDGPVFIPRTHRENLGPISDLLPETWQYNAELIEEYYKKRPWPVLVRLIQILLPLTSFLVNIWLDKVWRRGEEQRQRRAVQFKKILTKLGPTYIKIGQALSTRPDLVSPLYLVELTTLQDQLPSFSNEVAFRFIEEELGAKPSEIYAELSENPIAAASLGQVYRGRLKTGEKVAVKVQRPDLIGNITLDIYIMRTLAFWARKNIKQVRSDLVAITDELAGRIFEELNYIQEGHNAERFAELYGHMAEIYIPKIYWQYTGRRVLTMEWIDGIKLTHTREIQATGVDPTHLVDLGVQCSLRQLLEHGFFHADPHPGNLLAMPDGKLAYLDFGMMSNIKPHQRYGLIEAVVHLVNRDFEALAQDYVNLEFLTPETDLKPIIPALAQVFGNALGASVAELNFKSITDQMSAMMYEFPFRVPAYYALIIRSMVTLEGIAIGIDPEFKVLSKAYPYIAKRLLTDPSPELRASLKDLLFKDGSFRWNRLENLLNNAGDSDEFDFDRLLDQASDFLFSERGEFIRDRLVVELIDTIDIFGRRTWFNLTSAVRAQVGMAVQELPLELSQKSKAFEHITNIIEILRNTNGFDPVHLITVGTKLLSKPETHHLGQKVAEGLVQKALTRLIRSVLLDLDRDPKPLAPPVATNRALLPSS